MKSTRTAPLPPRLLLLASFLLALSGTEAFFLPPVAVSPAAQWGAWSWSSSAVRPWAVLAPPPPPSSVLISPLRSTASSSSEAGDFPSAMPPKPELTLEERMVSSATDFIVSLTNRLGDGVDPPQPELDNLKEARDSNADIPTLARRIYELMIEQGMTFDEDPETGTLTPTNFDIKNNLDVPEVRQEFGYLYKYGMTLIQQGLLEVDTAKDIIKERLISRTGLSPEEFDEWLGY